MERDKDMIGESEHQEHVPIKLQREAHSSFLKLAALKVGGQQALTRRERAR